jgi:hypothetical protein
LGIINWRIRFFQSINSLPRRTKKNTGIVNKRDKRINMIGLEYIPKRRIIEARQVKKTLRIKNKEIDL